MADGAGEDAEATDVGGFFAGFEEELVADANAEEGAVGGDPGFDRFPEAGLAEVPGAVAEGTLSGDDEGVAVGEFGGGGDVGAGAAAALGGFEGAAEVAAAVVDDTDFWRVLSYWLLVVGVNQMVPLVLGMPWTRESRVVAASRLLARALKRPSAMWWASRP